jgi:thymidine phosphorylase
VTPPLQPAPAALRARRAGIDTYQAPVVYMRADCPLCKSEGFEAQARVELVHGSRTALATVHHVLGDWLSTDEAALSEAAWRLLALREGDTVAIRHPPVLDSLRHLRAKIWGHRLDYPQLLALMRDVAAGRLSDLHLAAFVTACAGEHMSHAETVALTRAMVDVGERLQWPFDPVVDKHCVGGLPGNRTTLLVVPIVTACGLAMPKTSSRAITSPAGTADAMETLAPVDLDLASMRRVVERHGGCIVWGGAVALSPADDVLIRVERPLDLDGTGQMVASVLSKKAAAGARQVLIDIPVGPTAKVRSAGAAHGLAKALTEVGAALGLQVDVLQTDGSQPVGRGIGPALEAHDVLAVLQRRPEAPSDLRQRALALAGRLLQMGGVADTPEEGLALATETLENGRAWSQFAAICEAQGGLRTPGVAAYTRPVLAPHEGVVVQLDNRRIAMAAKLAGAPTAPTAGVHMDVRLGMRVARNQPLFTLHAASPGELEYAHHWVQGQVDIVALAESE